MTRARSLLGGVAFAIVALALWLALAPFSVALGGWFGYTPLESSKTNVTELPDARCGVPLRAAFRTDSGFAVTRGTTSQGIVSVGCKDRARTRVLASGLLLLGAAGVVIVAIRESGSSDRLRGSPST